MSTVMEPFESKERLRKSGNRKIAISLLILVLGFGVLVAAAVLRAPAFVAVSCYIVVLVGPIAPWFLGLGDLLESKGQSRSKALYGVLGLLGYLVVITLPDLTPMAAPDPDNPLSNYPRPDQRPTRVEVHGTVERKKTLRQRAVLLFILAVFLFFSQSWVGLMTGFGLSIPAALAIVDVMMMVAIVVWAIAHGEYARSKGYSFAFALLGLVPIVGFVIVLLLHDRFQVTATAAATVGPTAKPYKRPY